MGDPVLFFSFEQHLASTRVKENIILKPDRERPTRQLWLVAN